MSSTPKPPIAQQQAVSLALAIQQWREARDLSPRGLAKRAELPLQFIEDIEAGLILFLSVTERQRLSRVLRVHPALIAQVEAPSPNQDVYGSHAESAAAADAEASSESLADLAQAAMPVTALSHCPQCGGELARHERTRQDLNQHTLTVIRIHCTQCLFRAQREV